MIPMHNTSLSRSATRARRLTATSWRGRSRAWTTRSSAAWTGSKMLSPKLRGTSSSSRQMQTRWDAFLDFVSKYVVVKVRNDVGENDMLENTGENRCICGQWGNSWKNRCVTKIPIHMIELFSHVSPWLFTSQNMSAVNIIWIQSLFKINFFLKY